LRDVVSCRQWRLPFVDAYSVAKVQETIRR
jgi:hypothetical protein